MSAKNKIECEINTLNNRIEGIKSQMSDNDINTAIGKLRTQIAGSYINTLNNEIDQLQTQIAEIDNLQIVIDKECPRGEKNNLIIIKSVKNE